MQPGAHHHHLHTRKRKHNKQLRKYPHPDKKVRFLDRLVLVVAIIGPFMSFPQLFKIFYYQSAAGISVLSFALFSMINIPWIVYGFVHKDNPVVISSLIWFASNVMVAIGATIY